MKPFNIRIANNGKDVTLTILPAQEGHYKVIYFGGVLAAVKYERSANSWTLIPAEEVPPGDLPLYKYDPDADHDELILNEDLVDAMGAEIENVVNP